MRTRIIVGGVGALGLVALAAVLVPRATGMAMVTFSIIAFLWAVVGLLKPSWARLPNRMAAVWVWAISFGLFLGGGALLAPPPEVSNSNGLTAESPQERERRVQERIAETAAAREAARPTMAETWARTAYAPLDIAADSFFAQMPDELESAEWTGRREHTMSWADGSVVVTRWREGEPGQGLRLDYIDRIGR